MKKKVVFDGQFYAQKMTGQYRYANEILMEFDKLIQKNEFEIIVPESVNLQEKFTNLKIIHCGKQSNIFWTQFCLPKYLYQNNAISLGFCNTTPIIRPGITVLHDVGYKVMKKYYHGLYGKLSSLWHCFQYRVVVNSKNPIITVSDFSKKQIEGVYHVEKSRIHVIPNAWQHYNRIIPDYGIFNELKNIDEGEYYLALGSRELRKNFTWIIQEAINNPNRKFVIVGRKMKNAGSKEESSIPSNVVFTGFVSDEKVKALMKKSKAFLFPSIYEGFGIPPLEALSLKVPVACANTSSLPEICGNAVVYFDPQDYRFDLDQICFDEEKATLELEKFSWQRSAKLLYSFLKNYNG